MDGKKRDRTARPARSTTPTYPASTSSYASSSSGDELPPLTWPLPPATLGPSYKKRRKVHHHHPRPPTSPSPTPTSPMNPGRPNPPPPARLTVAAAQFLDRGSISKNTEEIIKCIKNAATKGAQVVHFHETATTGYFPAVILKSGRELRECESKICAACKANSIACIVGTPHFSERHGTFYNTVLVVDEKGRRVCRQTKRQLVPTDDWASPGQDMLVFRIAGTPCCAIICHDVRHPELVRLPVLQGARVVFYCSWETSANDREIPLDNTNELAVYRAQVQARAVENGVWIVHANAAANLKDRSRGSHGMSRIVDPKGHVVKEASPEAETLLVHKLDMKQSLAKYALKSLDFSFFLREWYISGAAYSNEVAIPPESPRLTPCSPKLK